MIPRRLWPKALTSPTDHSIAAPPLNSLLEAAAGGATSNRSTNGSRCFGETTKPTPETGVLPNTVRIVNTSIFDYEQEHE